MSLRKREKLFLGTLEEFRFDFGGDAVDDAAADHIDDEDAAADGPVRAPAPPRPVALSLEEVEELVGAANGAGSAFFSLPASAGTLDEAVSQFRRQVEQLVRREAKEQVDAERARAHAARSGKSRLSAQQRE